MQQEQPAKLVLPKYFHVLQVLGLISLGLGGGAIYSERRELLVEKMPILASAPLDWTLLLCGVVFILSVNFMAFKAARQQRENLARPGPGEQRQRAELIAQRPSRSAVVLTPFTDGARPDALRFMPYIAIPFILWIGMAVMNRPVAGIANGLTLMAWPATFFFLWCLPLFCRVELSDNQISSRWLILRKTILVADVESVEYQSAGFVTSLIIRTATNQLVLSSLSFSAHQLAMIRKYSEPSAG